MTYDLYGTSQFCQIRCGDSHGQFFHFSISSNTKLEMSRYVNSKFYYYLKTMMKLFQCHLELSLGTSVTFPGRDKNVVLASYTEVQLELKTQPCSGNKFR